MSLVISLVVLFCLGLIITLIGLHLSSHSHTHIQSDVAYVPRARRGAGQGKRPRYVRQNPETDQPYPRSRRSSTSVGRAGMGLAPAYRLRSSISGTGVDDAAGWSPRVPHWLKIMFLSGALFSICLLLFVQVMGPSLSPIMAILSNSLPQMQSGTNNTTSFAEKLGASNASQSLVRIAQLDQSQYNTPDEYNQWAYSACSTASMTEVINAYGHNYRIADILKVEIEQHAISPELGLLESKGIDRTMAPFGFKMVTWEHATLDNALAVANRGRPVIVSFANSGYWSGGHILVLRGGDAQNVHLADSSRLNLTVVPRAQFLQWWNGFMALAVPY